ncbi:dienelactone hydrolase family protein [Aliarcobacter butzleri]|uniref:dienelactone hydrolase family protein n=1 Tax=Aliarcobacter butzleri TaxID=28197 RepID=UPI00110BB972|nr:dienelactone hydrolase family protein [Aliarcobacter butzleri]
MKKILILTDIFGKNYTEEFLSFLDNYILLDPYNDSLFFENEEIAYDYYVRTGVQKKYYEKAFEISKKENIEIVIGFSIGGTIAWRLSENRFNKLKKIVCFYPSQIRNNLNIEPKIDTKIIFAKKEDSFDTQRMKEVLSTKENVRVEISDFEHGFMNKKSKNFDYKAFEKYTKQILNEIEQ